jgi:hypothetical protein
MGLLDAFQLGEALRLPFLYATTGSNTFLTPFSSTHSGGVVCRRRLFGHIPM